MPLPQPTPGALRSSRDQFGDMGEPFTWPGMARTAPHTAAVRLAEELLELL